MSRLEPGSEIHVVEWHNYDDFAIEHFARAPDARAFARRWKKWAKEADKLQRAFWTAEDKFDDAPDEGWPHSDEGKAYFAFLEKWEAEDPMTKAVAADYRASVSIRKVVLR